MQLFICVHSLKTSSESVFCQCYLLKLLCAMLITIRWRKYSVVDENEIKSCESGYNCFNNWHGNRALH